MLTKARPVRERLDLEQFIKNELDVTRIENSGVHFNRSGVQECMKTPTLTAEVATDAEEHEVYFPTVRSVGIKKTHAGNRR
jgi:hypothetical protein